MNFPHEKLPNLKCLLLGEIVFVFLIFFSYKETLHIHFLDSFPKENVFELGTNSSYVVDTKQIENAKCLKEANNARECFSILHDENLFTRNDVILMQFLCKETQCDDLYEKCIKYAKKYKALCFIENPPGMY